MRMGMQVYNYVIIFCSLLLALAVYTRSQCAYEALRGYKLLQLPSVRLLKKYIDANLEEARECISRLEEEGKIYRSKISHVKEELATK